MANFTNQFIESSNYHTNIDLDVERKLDSSLWKIEENEYLVIGFQ